MMIFKAVFLHHTYNTEYTKFDRLFTDCWLPIASGFGTQGCRGRCLVESICSRERAAGRQRTDVCSLDGDCMEGIYGVVDPGDDGTRKTA